MPSKIIRTAHAPNNKPSINEKKNPTISNIYAVLKKSIISFFPKKKKSLKQETLIQQKSKSPSQKKSPSQSRYTSRKRSTSQREQPENKNFHKRWPSENPVYEGRSSENRLYKTLILDIALIMTDELNNYIEHTIIEKNTHCFKLNKESGIKYNLKFNNLNTFLEQFKTPINLLDKFCSISGPKEKLFGICWNKTKILLKKILENYIIYENDNNNYENIKNLIFNIYQLINRLAVENINDKGKKFVFLNKCRVIIERILPETKINENDIKDKSLLGGKKKINKR